MSWYESPGWQPAFNLMSFHTVDIWVHLSSCPLPPPPWVDWVCNRDTNSTLTKVMLSGDMIRLLGDAYSNRFSLGSVSKIMRWCLTPYRANEVSKPQQKQTYGKYVSVIFSIPVWLNEQTPKPQFFVKTKHRQHFLENTSLCRVMRPM